MNYLCSYLKQIVLLEHYSPSFLMDIAKASKSLKASPSPLLDFPFVRKQAIISPILTQVCMHTPTHTPCHGPIFPFFASVSEEPNPVYQAINFRTILDSCLLHPYPICQRVSLAPYHHSRSRFRSLYLFPKLLGTFLIS